MHRETTVLIWLGIAAAGCSQAPAAARAPGAAQPTAPAAPQRQLEAAPAPSPASVEIVGDLRPESAAELSFKVGGRLAAVRARRGTRVQVGEIIALLADDEARALHAQAVAALSAARAQAAIAEDQAKRLTALAAEQAAPDSQAKTAQLTADAARAQAAQAAAAVALADSNLASHVLRAPFTGEVVRVPEGVGTTLAPGVPVVRVERLDALRLHGSVGEADLARLRVGDAVEVVPASGSRVIGRVSAVVRSLDPMSRRAPVEVEVPNGAGELVAGAYVRALVGSALSSSTEPSESR